MITDIINLIEILVIFVILISYLEIIMLHLGGGGHFEVNVKMKADVGVIHQKGVIWVHVHVYVYIIPKHFL